MGVSSVACYFSHIMASRFYVPARYALAVMLLLGFANVYALRVNLSVAMVKMKARKPHACT